MTDAAWIRIGACLAAALPVLLLSGCGDDDSANEADATSPTAAETRPTTEATSTTESDPGTEAEGGTTVGVWFSDGGLLARSPAKVEPTAQIGTAAVEALLEGPTNEQKQRGLLTGIPRDARLLNLEIADGVATADLSSEFEISSGTYAESFVLAQLVYTLTQFPTVDSVQIKLDGRKEPTYGGHGMDVSEPLTRRNYRRLTAAGARG